MSPLIPPLLRQLRGDPLGLGRAAQSRRSRELRARTQTADRVVQSVCPYCAVGCGQKVYVKDEKVVQIEGDPDSPISRGRLCPKGSASEGLVNSPLRETKVKYRPPARDRVGGALARAGDGDDRRSASSTRAARPGKRRPPTASRSSARSGSRFLGGATLDTRGELPDQEVLQRRGRRVDREPGAHMTLLHGPRSGDLVRPRRGHHVPAGPAELRLHPDHGLQHGRAAPGRLPVGDGGQGARRQGDARRSALHAHERDGGPARADPPRQRHRLPRRDRQLHLRARRVVPRLRARLHQRPGASSSPTSRTPSRAAGSSPAGNAGEGAYDIDTWAYDGTSAETAAGKSEQAGRRLRRAGARRARHGPSGRQAAATWTRRWRMSAASCRSCGATSPATRPRWSREVCGCSEEQFLAVARTLCENSGRERTSAICYAVGWTQHTTGVQNDPRRFDHPAAARQHRAPGRRHPGAARSRQHPGLDRHPDALQHPARATSRCRTPQRAGPRRVRRAERTGHGRVGQPALLHGLAAEGLVGRRGDGGERVLLRLPAAHRRRPLALRDDAEDARRRRAGDVRRRAEPDGGIGQREAAAPGARQARLARGARPLRDRDGRLLARLTGDRERRGARRRTSPPRSSSCRPPRTPRRTARSPTPSGCCSGTTRRSSRPATAARSCTGSTTWAGRSAGSSPARRTRATGRSST